MDFKPSLTEMNPQIAVGQELREGTSARRTDVAKGWGLPLPISRMGASRRARRQGVAHIRSSRLALSR